MKVVIPKSSMSARGVCFRCLQMAVIDISTIPSRLPPPKVFSKPLKSYSTPIDWNLSPDLESWSKRQKSSFWVSLEAPLKASKRSKNEVKTRFFQVCLDFHQMTTTQKERLWWCCFDLKKVWGPLRNFLRKSRKIDFFEHPCFPFFLL